MSDTIREVIKPLGALITDKAEGEAVIDSVVDLFATCYRKGALDLLNDALAALVADEEAGVPINRERVLAALHGAQKRVVEGPVPQEWA